MSLPQHEEAVLWAGAVELPKSSVSSAEVAGL